MAYLGLGVVFALLLSSNHGPPLIGIEQIIPVIADDTGGAGIHKRLDTALLARLNHRLGTIDIDLLKDLLPDATITSHRRSSMNNNIRLHILQNEGKLLVIGDIALVVRGVVVAVLNAAEVDGGDARCGPVGERLVDDVVAEEAIAADD